MSPTPAHAFGGTARGELRHPTQATHDLGVAAGWLRLHQVAPKWAAAWRGEDLLAHTRRGEKLPDAFIVDDDAELDEAFHQDWVSRNFPYQLW